MYRPTDEEIGRAILAGRQKAGILQEELSDRLAKVGLNWSRVTISKVERGERSVRATEIPAVAQALDMEVSDLFTPWESGLELRLRDAMRHEHQLDEELRMAEQEYARVRTRLADVHAGLSIAAKRVDALRLLIDFTRGAPNVEAVSWSAEALVSFWTNGFQPPLPLRAGDLDAQFGEHFASSVDQDGVFDLEKAFPHVRFGIRFDEDDHDDDLNVQWRRP
ncbi:helix-turn-helix domain-containing protein [Micrococcus sp. IITD107]|uniref:helix-turn-helix domain-containing protein n=1 Tax=Micrococcus sp. IITD107 TaxID=3342790 RepID=UPI0035B76931